MASGGGHEVFWGVFCRESVTQHHGSESVLSPRFERRRCTRAENLHTGTQQLRRLPQLQRDIGSLGSNALVTVASGSVRGAPLYTWAMQA